MSVNMGTENPRSGVTGAARAKTQGSQRAPRKGLRTECARCEGLCPLTGDPFPSRLHHRCPLGNYRACAIAPYTPRPLPASTELALEDTPARDFLHTGSSLLPLPAESPPMFTGQDAPV